LFWVMTRNSKKQKPMDLIVGLGNPGKKYKASRHNVGFFVVQALKKKLDFPAFTVRKKFKAEISKKNNLILAKPQTYMNSSGQSVAALLRFYKLKPKNLWVIHDDIDISSGKFKIQKNISSAGHKGVQSIINSLGTRAFQRLRMGIKPETPSRIPTEKFVLQKLTFAEKNKIKKTTQEAIGELMTNFQFSIFNQ